MSRAATRLIKRSFLIVVMLLSAGVLGVLIRAYWTTVSVNLLKILDWIIFLVGLVGILRDKFPWLFYFTAGLRAIFVGTDTTWTLHAVFPTAVDGDGFVKSRDALSRYVKNPKIYHDSEASFVALLDGLHVELHEIPDDANAPDSSGPRLYFHIVDYHAPIDKTLDVFEDTVIPLLNLLEECVEGHHGTLSYALNIRFPGKNPYLGLYTRRIPVSSLQSFTARVRFGDESEVRIDKSSMEITAVRTSALQARLARTLPILTE